MHTYKLCRHTHTNICSYIMHHNHGPLVRWFDLQELSMLTPSLIVNWWWLEVTDSSKLMQLLNNIRTSEKHRIVSIERSLKVKIAYAVWRSTVAKCCQTCRISLSKLCHTHTLTHSNWQTVSSDDLLPVCISLKSTEALSLEMSSSFDIACFTFRADLAPLPSL